MSMESFQLTASRGGWLWRIFQFCIDRHFNSQPHEEADGRAWMRWFLRIRYFNSQPHEEADVLCYCSAYADWYFNSQPHEEADRSTGRNRAECQYFNSQPHEEADSTVACCTNGRIISTHSLTRRLTVSLWHPATKRVISTHSLTRRLTTPFELPHTTYDISTHSLTRRLTFVLQPYIT